MKTIITFFYKELLLRVVELIYFYRYTFTHAQLSILYGFLIIKLLSVSKMACLEYKNEHDDV